MTESLLPYQPLLGANVLLALLVVIQFAVADVVGIRKRHVPGMPVATGHDDLLFRATRAHANTLEQLGLYVLLVLTVVLLGADPAWSARAAWLFVIARAVHMACYYADLRLARSIAFAIGQAGLVGLLVLAIVEAV